MVLALTVVVYVSSMTINIFVRDSVSQTPAVQKPAPQSPYNITLTLTQNPATSQVITWETLTPGKSTIQYIKSGPNAAKFQNPTICSSTDLTLKTGTGRNLYFHYAVLTGLLPDTKYFYRVGAGSPWSNLFTFTTAGNYDQFKFLVFGDSQSTGNYSTWKDILQKAAKTNPEARFFVNTGDLVDEGKNISQWNNWFLAGKGVIDRIPAMPVRGNHDMYKPYWLAYFKLPANGPKGAQGLTYSYDYGPVHFVMLDNVEPGEKNTLTAQKDWLIKDLQGTQKPWKIIFFHKPPYANKLKRDNRYLLDAYGPIFDKYHVNLVFNGHDHDVARTLPIFQQKAVKDTSKGTVYYVSGRSGTKYYQDVAKTSLDGFFYNPVDQPNYIVVNVNRNRVETTVFKQDGKVIDKFILNR